MKKIFLLFGLALSLSFSAQSVRKDIEVQFRDYSSLIINRQFGKAFDLYANPEFLKIVPKEHMVNLMNQLFSSPEMEFKFHDPEDILVLDDPFTIKDQSYIRVKYSQKLEIKLNKSEVKTEDFLSVLQAEFGLENVKYDSQSGFFRIFTKKDVLASSADMKNWKFTVLERKQLPLLKQFIPEKFLQDLK